MGKEENIVRGYLFFNTNIDNQRLATDYLNLIGRKKTQFISALITDYLNSKGIHDISSLSENVAKHYADEILLNLPNKNCGEKRNYPDLRKEKEVFSTKTKSIRFQQHKKASLSQSEESTQYSNVSSIPYSSGLVGTDNKEDDSNVNLDLSLLSGFNC